MENRVRIDIWFDCKIKTKSGWKPFYDFVTVEEQLKDHELKWFHDGYGYFRLYRLWKVDDENFIAEDTHCMCHKESTMWQLYREQPEMALITHRLQEESKSS